ncbi:ATP-binding protein [Lentzea sp.]|uniref:ATP-binding protein n=1 Tax=Lentzea sp. TaxID=56099 RepID=UPI002ED0D635
MNSGYEDDPEPFVLDLSGEQLPPLVQLRQWAAKALADLDDDHLLAVLLVATELVTNAYDHASGPLRLLVRRSAVPCEVSVSVDDDSSERPAVGRSRLGDARGRGLLMVESVSKNWGVRPLPEGGKRVWALIACDSNGTIACLPRGR